MMSSQKSLSPSLKVPCLGSMVNRHNSQVACILVNSKNG